MADLEKVSAGQTIRALPAGDWNAFIDTARAHQAGQFAERFEGELFDHSPTIIQVANHTGANRQRRQILGIDRPIPLPSGAGLARLKNELTLAGVVPTLDHRGKFVVLKEAIASDLVGEAIISGVTLLEVLVVKHEHRCADVLPGSTDTLLSCHCGAAQMLWREGGLGRQWAVVRIANVCACPDESADYDSGSGGSGSGSGSGSGKLCLNVVTEVRFDPVNCQLTVCTRQICLPPGSTIGPPHCGDKK